MAVGKKTGGRSAGVPNKATAQAREAIAAFVDGNVDRLVVWLDQIAADSPKDAFDRYMSVVEYHIPKLARVDSNISGQVGVTVNWPLGKTALDE